MIQRLCHYYVCVRNIIRKSIYTQLFKIKAFTWGGELGAGAVAYGMPVIHLLPGSRLRIGRNFRLRSGRKDNYIGVHTPCIFSTISRTAEIIIGDNCGMTGAVIGASKSVIIGNDVRIGANSVISDNDWHPEDPRSGEPREVVIEDNVWVGYSTVVLKGVRIGRNSVIGACSVVTRDIPPNVVAAGNPCKVIREIKA